MQNDIYCVDNVVCVSQVLLYPTEFLSLTIPEKGYFTKQHNLKSFEQIGLYTTTTD